MDQFFTLDPESVGSKGLVFIGDKVVVYRRDDKTDVHPLEIDLPGGGAIKGETPFETFRREVKEEFGLPIKPKDIVYARRYASTLVPGQFGYFPVAQLPASMEDKIVYGDEGLEYMLLSLDEYIALKDAWKAHQVRALDYKKTLS
jgi:8-oxo-dGTP diphosphatase